MIEIGSDKDIVDLVCGGLIMRSATYSGEGSKSSSSYSEPSDFAKRSARYTREEASGGRGGLGINYYG